MADYGLNYPIFQCKTRNDLATSDTQFSVEN